MHKQEMFITDVPFIVDVRTGRIKKLRLGYFMETEATWFSPAARNKTIFVTYLYVASCRGKEKQLSTGRELKAQESWEVANSGLAELISLLYSKSLIKRIAVDRLFTERRLGWSYTDPSSSQTSLQMWSCHYWNASTSGEEEEVSKELGARPPLPHLWQHSCWLLLKVSRKTSHSKLPLSSLFRLGAADTRNRRGLYLKTQPEHSALHSCKKTWRPFPTPARSLGKEVSAALCLAAPILLLRKQIMLPTARVRSKLILLMLLTFCPGFLRSKVLQTPTRCRWIVQIPLHVDFDEDFGQVTSLHLHAALHTTTELSGVGLLSRQQHGEHLARGRALPRLLALGQGETQNSP